jgi:hypothetical protein
MHIIFIHVNHWQLPLIKLLKYFHFKVFYLFIESKNEFEQKEIANELKKKNIFPLPIEFEKKIPKTFYSALAEDTNELAYNKNIKMISNENLKKYCKLFSISKEETKKLRLIIQDTIAEQQRKFSARIELWSNLHPSQKIIFVSFKFKSFFAPSVAKNTIKIIIPINIFWYLIKFFKAKLLIFLPRSKKTEKEKNEILNNKGFDNFEEKDVAFVTHKGTIYGSKKEILFEKTLYYSDDKKSHLNKYNILHLDYSNNLNPDEKINWVCLKKIKVSKINSLFQTLLGALRTFYLVRSWSTFLVWILFIQQYNTYIKYCIVIKSFTKLKIALIDYDYLCPKTLILAFKKNNIKTVSTQERFITAFYTSYCNIMLDTYYTASEYTANFIKNSKYHDIQNVIPMGQYRSDYISLCKKENAPEEISKAKSEGKKILIIFGNQSPNNWFESHTHPLINWSAQINFLENCIELSKNLKNTYIILRYKTLGWFDNKFFENILSRIENCENITISKNYSERFYSYKLCAYADLIIARHTSIADECLSSQIPVLFYEYSHNMNKIVLNEPNYLPSELICHNFEELLQKSKSFLFDSSSKLQNIVNQLNETIYYVNKKGNIKNKIIRTLENLIS